MLPVTSTIHRALMLESLVSKPSAVDTLLNLPAETFLRLHYKILLRKLNKLFEVFSNLLEMIKFKINKYAYCHFATH